MASQCKRQQCTIDRRGFRQELDSWRHKLIHCVGFESILEGLFGSELVEDLKLFKDLEPATVSDWSFDENCIFCCLRRDKVKEHLIGLSNEGLQDTLRPLLVKDQTTISRLEKQAEEFLNAVLCRKDVPSFLDPHIPVVAREILQRMIRQFAAEYTSKTNSPQDTCSDPQPSSDQSLSTPPLVSGASAMSPPATVAGPVHNQNPVLSKLLMADQDAPLDLTIKKLQSEPDEQEGVLDLSIKKSRVNSSSLPVNKPCLSLSTSVLKGDCSDLRAVKAKELQSTSTLEQFMAKLCLHHQRQIIDAIGFLQTEVKALASSSTQPTNKSASGILATTCSIAVNSGVSCSQPRFPSESTLKSEVQDLSHSFPISCAMKKGPETEVSMKAAVAHSPVLDLRSPGSESNQALVPCTVSPTNTKYNRINDHAPLKMKIMKTSNIAAGKTLSCVLTTSLSSDSGTLENRQGNSNSSNRIEAHSARLSSSVKRHNHVSHTNQPRQRETLGHAKDASGKPFSVHATITLDSPRTARKTIRASSDHQTRDSPCRVLVDPDLGHCDIVYIDKPITECLKEKQRNMIPRRNARKSTRGHMYSDEIWELKTVRTLAGRGNCPNPMPELTTLVTPRQILSKPEGVPPVDMPFAGACLDTMSEQMSTEESDERVIPGSGDMVEVAASEVDTVVETSQTDVCQSKAQSAPQSIVNSPTENRKIDVCTSVDHETTMDLVKTIGSEDIVSQETVEAEQANQFEPTQLEKAEGAVSETVTEPVENNSIDEVEPQMTLDTIQSSEHVQQNSPQSQLDMINEETQEVERERLEDEQPMELQPKTQISHDDTGKAEKSNHTCSVDEDTMKEQEVKTAEAVEGVSPLETSVEEDDDYDVSSKTLDTLLKELPPWRRKKGTVILLPKRLRHTESVIVGYVNGRPISASDRSLRRRFRNSGTSRSRSPIKSTPTPNKAIVDPSETVNLERHTTKSPGNLGENTAITQKQAELASSLVSKSPLRPKQIQKHKKVQKDRETLPGLSDPISDSFQNINSKRQLRSTSQKPDQSPASLPSSNSASLDTPPSPHNVATDVFIPPLLPMPSPLIGSSSPAPSEQSCLSTVQENTLEVNSEKNQPMRTTSEETQKMLLENLHPKQKLRSAKAGLDGSKNEMEHVHTELRVNQNPDKTDVQTQLRSKQVVRKESLPEQPNASLKEKSESGEKSSSQTDRPTRMPLRSESSKAESSPQSLTQSIPLENKKLTLRSQKLSAVSTSAISVVEKHSDGASTSKMMQDKATKAHAKPPPLTATSSARFSSNLHAITSRPEPLKQTNKFFETLTGEENQQLLTNLNIKYDKMQKGWVPLDKEGQPATKYKNKADRQAAIWKSKRRARKPKSAEHHKYSPVQMLFMKGFDLTSICRWFLESTETKSLVIVKKVNTRLPSETQLCFHSSSSTPGTSQGVFPSLQAERLKKHLKKFAIASPVKSNPKSQKLIAKALEQEAIAVKGKERRELPSTTQNLIKSYCSIEAHVPRGEAQKASGKSKNPASARILRKYSNIREKMQVQQTDVRLKNGSKSLKANNLKRLTTTKSASKSNLKPPLKAQKSAQPVSKHIREFTGKMEKRKKLDVRKAVRQPVYERAVRAQTSVRAIPKKEEFAKRGSPRLGSPRTFESNPLDVSKNRGNKRLIEGDKEMEKSTVNKMNAPSLVSEIKHIENISETPQPSLEVKGPSSPDQVLTRSQRKMEAPASPLGNLSQMSKRSTKLTAINNVLQKPGRRPEGAASTRRGPLKPVKRSQAAMLPRSASKRAQEYLVRPAKRTRTSHTK